MSLSNYVILCAYVVNTFLLGMLLKKYLEMNNPIDTFFIQQKEPVKSCLLYLRKLILEQNELITEKMNYGMPCYYYKGKRVCYLWTDKKLNQPYILLVDGNKIDHPDLVQGERKRMKIFYADAVKNIPVNKINKLLKMVLQLYPDLSIEKMPLNRGAFFFYLVCDSVTKEVGQ